MENIIKNSKLYSFSTVEMSQELRTKFGFKIPDYVVQTAINKLNFVTREYRRYKVNASGVRSTEFSQKYAKVEQENNKLVDQLTAFVEEKKGSLSETEKDKLIKDFSEFLLE